MILTFRNHTTFGGTERASNRIFNYYRFRHFCTLQTGWNSTNMSRHIMNLRNFLTTYVNEHETGVRPSTISAFHKPAISDLCQFLNRDATLADFNRDTINKWIEWKLAKGCNITTIGTRKAALLALWRAAVAKDMIDEEPRKIRRLPRVRRIVKAWTKTEISTLMDTIRKIAPDRHVTLQKLPMRDYYETICMAGYDTGMRLSDLLSIERDWVRLDSEGAGYLSIIQSKSERPKSSRISPETMSRIDAFMELMPRKLIWPARTRRSFYEQMREIIKTAGIPTGTFRWLRRSGATHVELDFPGKSFIHCGHADSRVTFAHYIDREQLTKDVVSPVGIW
jgi:site-specific recombinase XerD